MFRRLSFLLTLLSFSLSLQASGRRPPVQEGLATLTPMVSYVPHVEKLADRYRLTVDSPEALPHYLIEKSEKKIWVRLVSPSVDESQILEGDSVIREVRLVRRQHSADVILKLGDDAVSNEVFFDEGKKKIVVDVFTSDRLNRQLASNPPVTNDRPVLKSKGSLKKELKLSAAPRPKSEAVIKPAADKGPRVSRAPDEMVIVVDAGHGGMDSGAIGTRGTMEKDINLEFAKALAKALSKEKHTRVVMTRTNDDFVPLQERTRIANDEKADFFISIHCNSSLSPKRDGFEAYFLSPEATDKAAASVARLENSVVALESKGTPASSRLNQVLASMAVGNFINESSKLASIICRNVRSRTSQDVAEVKEADFFVLRGAQMPSVLIELEYVSNPISEFRLRSSRYRAQLISGVVEGIKAYERQAKLEREVVASQMSGETLPDSAR